MSINKELWKEMIEKNKFLKFKDIIAANFDPHPVMISPTHIEYANNHNGGIIDESVLKEIGCKHVGGCNIPFDEHRHDNILLLQLRDNCTKEDITEHISSLKSDMKSDKITGLTFVDTPEEYRIKESKEVSDKTD